eukprot:3225749-Amphidinium_carterae.1
MELPFLRSLRGATLCVWVRSRSAAAAADGKCVNSKLRPGLPGEKVAPALQCIVQDYGNTDCHALRKT